MEGALDLVWRVRWMEGALDLAAGGRPREPGDFLASGLRHLRPSGRRAQAQGSGLRRRVQARPLTRASKVGATTRHILILRARARASVIFSLEAWSLLVGGHSGLVGAGIAARRGEV